MYSLYYPLILEKKCKLTYTFSVYFTRIAKLNSSNSTLNDTYTLSVILCIHFQCICLQSKNYLIGFFSSLNFKLYFQKLYCFYTKSVSLFLQTSTKKNLVQLNL